MVPCHRIMGTLFDPSIEIDPMSKQEFSFAIILILPKGRVSTSRKEKGHWRGFNVFFLPGFVGSTKDYMNRLQYKDETTKWVYDNWAKPFKATELFVDTK